MFSIPMVKSQKGNAWCDYTLNIYDIYASLPHLQAKLRNAAKSRLNRWVRPHKRLSHLDAPEWLKKEWSTGSKNAIADLLSQVNFNKDRLSTSDMGQPCIFHDSGWTINFLYPPFVFGNYMTL